jgi:hypothetical protein
MQPGGDGNEIDVRSTTDGVLVCFHDDTLDRLLQGQGEVSELTWDELPSQLCLTTWTCGTMNSSLESIVDPRWNNPRAWTDFRVKMVVFPCLGKSLGDSEV